MKKICSRILLMMVFYLLSVEAKSIDFISEFHSNMAFEVEDEVLSTCVPPEINCGNPNIVVNTLPGQCGAWVNFNLTSSGTSPVITYSHASGSWFSRGTTMVTATAQNACGTSVCSFMVTVDDVENPVLLNCPPSASIATNPGLCTGTTPDFLSQMSYSDNCPNASGFVSISAGGINSYGIKTSGSLWAWGNNDYGQLGQFYPPPSSLTPIQVGGDKNWVKVAGGTYHVVGIRSNGTLWGWGRNHYGQLGDGTTINKQTPVQIGIATNWIHVAAGANFSIGIKSDGTLWAWGDNTFGQLGDGTTVGKLTPVQIGAAKNWISVDAGDEHCIAIKSDGTLWTWGRNQYGQLGDGTITNKNVPGQIGIGSSWGKVSAGMNQCMAIQSNGTLWGWGWNPYGQLGIGNTSTAYTPIQVGTATNWNHVSTASYNTTAIKTNGTLWSWGYGTYGQIGNGSNPIVASTPVQVGAATDWVESSTGGFFNLAFKSNGELYGWGFNQHGTLGNGSTLNKNIPTLVNGSSAQPVLTQTPSPGSISFNGVMTLIYTAVDASGNSVACSNTLETLDQEAPTLTCPADIYIPVPPGSNGSIVNYMTPTAIDNCSNVYYINRIAGLASGSVFPIGITPVTYEASDFFNVSQCTFNIIVGTAPSIVCPSNITVTAAPGQCGANVSFSATETTGIPASVITYSVAPGSYFTVGTHTVTATATNAIGSSSCTFTVTVTDNELPAITCPGNISVNNDPGQCGAVVSYNVTFSDNCQGATIQQTAGIASGQTFPVGTTVNTYVVTDAAGNQATCSFSVTVTDTETPYFTNVPADFNSCNPVSWTLPVPNDNCSGATVGSSHQPGATFPSGTTTVTYTVTDASGLSSVASFKVTLLEPSVAAQSIASNRDYNNICSGENITLTLNGGSLGDGAQWVWYNGSCGGTPVASGVTSITVDPATTTTYFARAEGDCNNTTCVQLTVVVSSSAPVTTPVYSTVPAYGAPGITDVISVVPVTGATYYRWFTNNGQINGVLFNNQLSPVQTAVPSVDITFVLSQQNYQVRVIAGNACGRSGQANTVIRGTVAAPSSLTGPTSVCPGQSHQYTVSAIPSQSGNTQVTYNWQLIPASAGTISGSGLTRTITFAPGFTGAQLCVNGVSGFGLPGAPLCINITTGAPAPATITGLNAVCEGASGVSYSAAPVAGAIAYNWTSVPAGVIFSGNTQSVTATFPNGSWSGTICVAAVTTTCGTSQPTCINVGTITPVSLGAITGPVSGVCNESNVNYSVTAGADSYSWTLPSGANGSSTTSSINVNFGAGFTAGNIEVTGNFACNSSTVSLPVTGAPDMPAVASGGLNSVCPGAAGVQYSVTSTGATAFSWTATGVATTSGCANPPLCSSYNVDQWGLNPTLSVTASNICGTSAPFVFPVACRFMESGSIEASLYPNPTKGKVTLEFTSESSSGYYILITDMVGRKMMEKEITATKGLNKENMDLSSFGAGIYLVHLKDQGGNVSVTKVAVE